MSLFEKVLLIQNQEKEIIETIKPSDVDRIREYILRIPFDRYCTLYFEDISEIQEFLALSPAARKLYLEHHHESFEQQLLSFYSLQLLNAGKHLLKSSLNNSLFPFQNETMLGYHYGRLYFEAFVQIYHPLRYWPFSDPNPFDDSSKTLSI